MAVAALAAIALAGCASVARDPYDAPGAGPNPSEQAVNACHPVAHLQCIYLTGAEVIEDGRRRQWTRHWFRMSYIGRACEREYGTAAAVVFEGFWAPLHYFWVGAGNALAVFLGPPDEGAAEAASARR